MNDDLIQQFFQAYQKARTEPVKGTDLTLEELIDIEDQLSEAVGELDLLEVDGQDRKDLWGKRTPDLPDLMSETAEGLRECPQIAEKIKTDPDLFDHLSQQDLATGGLIQVFQSLHNGADTGMLLCAADADSTLDTIEEEVRAALKDETLTPQRRQVIDNKFSEPIAKRQGIVQRAKASTDAMNAKLQAHKNDLQGALDQKETDQQVRDFIADAQNAAQKKSAGTKKKTKKAPPQGLNNPG